MLRLLHILCMHSFIAVACCQSLSVNDLLALPSLSPKNFDNYMSKKGFVFAGRSFRNDAMISSFFEKKKAKNKDTLYIQRSVDMYKNDDTYCFALHTTSLKEYTDGLKQLKKTGFFCGNYDDTCAISSLLFQKRNISVQTSTVIEDGEQMYTFLLQHKQLPDPANIMYADDLLQFNSHEYLVGFFGENNVKKDIYYFSEKEVKKCSVLYPNTGQQAVFIWEDETNLKNLSYILISGILPTISAVQYSGYVSQNKWILKNGIYSGMSLKELVKLNENDLDFYGRNSEFSFMVTPQSTGNFDFKKTGIMLGCINCNASPLLDDLRVSAREALMNSLTLHIFYIMLSP